MALTRRDAVARKGNPSRCLDPLVARRKREEYLACIRKWSPRSAPRRVLKAGLFEEAFGKDSLLPGLFPGAATRIGMDVAAGIVEKARAHCAVPPAGKRSARAR